MWNKVLAACKSVFKRPIPDLKAAWKGIPPKHISVLYAQWCVERAEQTSSCAIASTRYAAENAASSDAQYACIFAGLSAAVLTSAAYASQHTHKASARAAANELKAQRKWIRKYRPRQQRPRVIPSWDAVFFGRKSDKEK